MMAYRDMVEDEILFDDDEEIEAVIRLQRRPRLLRQRVDYLLEFDDHDFQDRFRISKETFRVVLGLVESQVIPPSDR